jgi:hypothetical protein
MSLQSSRDALYSAHKKLLSRWEHVEPHWQDVMKAQFVEQVLVPLSDRVIAALLAIDQMEGVSQEMRQDCAGDPFDIYEGDEEA